MELPRISKLTNRQRNVVLSIVAICLFTLIASWLFYPFDFDKLPPKTPRKIARNISGLDIPEDIEIVFFNRNEQSFGGDYSNEIIIQLTTEQTEKLAMEWEKKGYGKEPVPKPDPEYPLTYEGFIVKNTKPSTIGLYRHFNTQNYWTDVVLDISDNRLLVFNSSE